VWFSKTAIGHNTLAKTIKWLCEVAGIKGFSQIILCEHVPLHAFLKQEWMNS